MFLSRLNGSLPHPSHIGNSIDSIAGLVEVAERFGRGESDGWRGEEIDIRDNQIPKVRGPVRVLPRQFREV